MDIHIEPQYTYIIKMYRKSAHYKEAVKSCFRCGAQFRGEALWAHLREAESPLPLNPRDRPTGAAWNIPSLMDVDPRPAPCHNPGNRTSVSSVHSPRTSTTPPTHVDEDSAIPPPIRAELDQATPMAVGPPGLIAAATSLPNPARREWNH